MDETVTVRPGLVWTRDVLAQWGRWTRERLGMTILLSVLAFIFGWVWNTYIMAVELEGYVVDPGGETIATAEGQPLNWLFWLLLFSLLSGLISYGWQRGWRTLATDLATIPRRFGETMSHSRGTATAMLLWGASISLLISTVISSAVSLALGLVLLTLAATPVGVILNFALIRIWKALCGIASPRGGAGAVLLVGPFMVMVGEAAGLLLDWLVGSWWIGLALGVVCAVVSVLLARGAVRPGAAAVALLFAVTLVVSVLRARGGWADDGGWQECVTDTGEPCSGMGLAGIIAWFGSEGAGPVMGHAALGGGFAGLGTAIGIGLGSAAASLAAAAAQAGTLPRSGGVQGEPGAANNAGQPGASTLPGQSGAPGQGGQSAPGPGQAGGDLSTAGHGGEATAEVNWQNVAQEQPMAADQPATPDQPTMPIVPQQAASPPVEDFLPDAPDKKKDKKDNENPPTQR